MSKTVLILRAGTLQQAYGPAEDVDVRVLPLANCTPADIHSARCHVAILCQIAARLGASVAEIKGFVVQTDPPRARDVGEFTPVAGARGFTPQLLIVVDGAERSLGEWLQEAGGALPLPTAVRFICYL